MNKIPALLSVLSLALAIGIAQAQSESTHEHGDAPAAATTPATPASAAPAAAMGCAGPMMHGTGAMPGGAAMHGQGPTAAMHEAMACGAGMPMAMSGDVDKDFAAMMLMHHRQGVRMADVEIAHGKDAGLKALAKTMREAQLAEIAKLEAYR